MMGLLLLRKFRKEQKPALVVVDALRILRMQLPRRLQAGGGQSLMKAYLDNNATTPLAPEVQKAVVDSLPVYGNPSSAHAFGVEARELVEQSRDEVARLLQVPSDEIIFNQWWFRIEQPCNQGDSLSQLKLRFCREGWKASCDYFSC